jgi:hypothetical protein
MPRLLVLGDDASSRVSSASTTVALLAMIAGPACRRATPQRDPVVPLVAEFLSIAGDQQQRVVGARPEHQDAGDTGGGAVGAGAGRGRHRAAEHGGHPVGEGDHGQRDEPQHRRPVGDDQQQRDHRRRDREKREVGSRERIGDVGTERRPAGDLGPQRPRQTVRRCRAQ